MTTPDLYPVSLRLLGRPVLLVGGGRVAGRRARALLDAGAVVTVVAPRAGDDVAGLAGSGLLTWVPRPYRGTDLDEAWFVQTATGIDAVDEAVAADADARRIWCVNASDAEASAAWTPAVARAGDVTVAVNAGGDPRRASALRDAIRLALDTGQLPLRRRRRTLETGGRVALVGGGPGESGLITVRGRQLLATADVVVADRLGPRELLEDLDAEVRVIEVGKSPGNHPVGQDEINSILVREARSGQLVVRLKGGDPYVLGRGGEEARYCRDHGIDVEVVPGVTSAISVPAAAGIPVTHRGTATGFTVVTGHADLAELSVRRDHTLVLLMGVRRLAQTATQLCSQGLGPQTPVAVVERGWMPDQSVTIGTLQTIAAQAEVTGVRNPAVIVVGDVVRLSPYAPNVLNEIPKEHIHD
ncbi:uroporphyrinogen-III C-methyltransferase [Citricoccus nitrophenolicus]|uniref:uroporphyrinogen-III C-methyltransferase n=1 Tax=Citricoccus nitrophenolicus TaxID=863575 RepID=UPI0031F03215